jgi:GNAT superfamily N-acetyltransferase
LFLLNPFTDLIAHMKFIPQEVLDGIGRNAIKEIPNKATLKFGWSPISLGIYKFLRRRKDLGLHTDGLSDELCELIEEGVINNKYKTIDTGRSVVSFAFGSQATYNFIDRNPAIEFHPGRYVNDPQVLAKIDNLVAIVGALKVDLTGQIATDSIKHKFYGGVWSDVETIRGARLSEGGKALVLLQSESVSGRSNIVFALPPGTGVSITRSDVEYVITDYGTAYLDGKSVRERALALINIAHPKYRDGLLAEAKQHGYISERQPGKSFRSIYPEEFECLHTTTTGKQVFVRPIKIVDEGALRSFFHALSDRSVYLRYFRRLPSMPQRILQQYTDVDYTRDMALVVLYPPDSTQQQLVAIGQWISDLHDNVPEIAFQVLDEWQGQGLGLYLFQRLVEISRFFGIPKFKADVLGQNRGMQAVFKKSGIPYMTRTDFGTITYLFDLTRNEEEKKSSSN